MKIYLFASIRLAVVFVYLTIPSYAFEFQNFKLKGELHELNLKKKSDQFIQFLYSGLNNSHKSNSPLMTSSSLHSKSVNIDDNNQLYSDILSYLRPRYQTIGHDEAQSIFHYNNQFDLGQKNHTGFNWQRPLGQIQIGADRQIQPDLFSDQWIVTDKFYIAINASTYLSNLLESGSIDITQKQLAAFAGIEFTRVYKHIHFEKSYQEALFSDYENLFMTFLYFNNPEKIKNIKPYEYITKEDFLSYSVGGVGLAPQIPLTAGIMANLSIAGIFEYNKLASLTIQAVGDQDQNDSELGYQGGNDEFIRVSYELSKQKTGTLRASLEADFFELIKLTLLSSEVDYSLTQAEKIHLSFHHLDKKYLFAPGPLFDDFSSLLKLKAPESLGLLKKFVVSNESRIKENLSSKFSLLFFGTEKKKETEHITLIKNGKIKHLFRSTYENIQYIQGILKSVLGQIFQSLFNIPTVAQQKISRAKRLSITYDQESLVTEDDGEVYLNGLNEFNIHITHQYQAIDLDGYLGAKQHREYAKKFVTSYTNLSSDFGTKIYLKEFKGPLDITTTYYVAANNLEYFHQLPMTQVKNYLNFICLSKNEIKMNNCKSKLSKLYDSYKLSLNKYQEVPLWKLRDFLITLNNYSSNQLGLALLFGNDLFFYGSFKSLTSDNKSFMTYYKGGVFRPSY